MSDIDGGIWVLALLCTGAGLVSFTADRRNPASRALALWLLMMGLALGWGGLIMIRGMTPMADIISATLESGAIAAALEWGRRIAQSARRPWRGVTRSLFLAAQILIVVFWGLRVGYALVLPELAGASRQGIVPVTGAEFAVFAPLIGTAALLGAIAVLMLLVVGIDPIERVRLVAFMAAAPFLLSGLIFTGPLLGLLMTCGLLIFFAGSVRYLVLQVARGTRLRQFVASEVAALAQDDIGVLERRQRRCISVVACDLRGFTALAETLDSDAVMALLERYYARAGELATQHGATVKDHAGDGILMLVGAPVPLRDAAQRALALASQLTGELHPQMQRDAGGLGLGVGVATGEVTVGAVRGAGRMEYAAVGTAVNLAARLCSRAAAGEVLTDTRTLLDAGRTPGAASQQLPLKGFAAPVAAHVLVSSPTT